MMEKAEFGKRVGARYDKSPRVVKGIQRNGRKEKAAEAEKGVREKRSKRPKKCNMT